MLKGGDNVLNTFEKKTMPRYGKRKKKPNDKIRCIEAIEIIDLKVKEIQIEFKAVVSLTPTFHLMGKEFNSIESIHKYIKSNSYYCIKPLKHLQMLEISNRK